MYTISCRTLYPKRRLKGHSHIVSDPNSTSQPKEVRLYNKAKEELISIESFVQWSPLGTFLTSITLHLQQRTSL